MTSNKPICQLNQSYTPEFSIVVYGLQQNLTTALKRIFNWYVMIHKILGNKSHSIKIVTILIVEQFIGSYSSLKVFIADTEKIIPLWSSQ